MGYQSALMGALAAANFNGWWEADAKFVWDPYVDTDATAVNPTIGGAMPKTSTNPATAAAGLWDMTGAVYSAAGGSIGATPVTQPYLVALAIDKFNQASTFCTNVVFGIGTNSVALGFSAAANAPVWKVASNSGAFSVQYSPQATITSGVVEILWIYFDPASGTTFVAGNGQNTVTSSGDVHASVTTGFNSDVTFGTTFGSTTGTSQLKHGIAQVVSRAGLTLAQAKAIVAKMQTAQGMGS
jgi:hypothetical protein